MSGCNEFIDLTGKFINRINETTDVNNYISISVQNLQSHFLPNIVISIIDDHDSLLIASPKFTNSNNSISFSLPDEQVREISPEAQNLIIIAEHPDIDTYFITIPITELNKDQYLVREFVIDISQEILLRSNIEKYQFYNKTQKKFLY